MSCDCTECSEYGGPNPTVMTIRFLVLGLQLLVGMLGMARDRSWKALTAFLTGIVFFGSVLRYLICARCEGYGKRCYSLYLGKATSTYLPRVHEKEIGPSAMVLEVIALALISQSPVVGIKNRRTRALYALLSTATFAMHFTHACRHCARYATDWKSRCPSARAYRRFFGAGREPAL